MKVSTSHKNDASLVIGVEFDRETISAALIDEHARLIVKQRIETPPRTTRSAVSGITQLILGVASAQERGSSPIHAIGVCVPGTVDPPTGRVSISGLKGWTRVALRQMIEESLSDSGHDIRTPFNQKRARAQHSSSPHPLISINSRAACAAAAESWIGAARSKTDVVYFSLGRDVEAGILSNGQVLKGASGQAGSVGWLGLSENFKIEYETRGCLATEAATASLTRRALDEWSEDSTSMLGKLIKAEPAQLDSATIIRAARGGDALALRVVNETCSWIGRAIANLITVLNPDVVVIGGDLGLSLKPFFDQVREEARLWIPSEMSRQCRIVGATLGEKAGLLGAARLVWLKN